MGAALIIYLVLIAVGAMVDYNDYYNLGYPKKPRRFIIMRWSLLMRIFLTWPFKAAITILSGW